MKLEEMESKTKESQMNHPEIVSEAEWLVARKDLLTREKEFSRQRDALSAARRQMPMVKIDKEYVFDGPNGKETLADQFDGATWHLPHRDVSLVVVSRAPLSEFEPYKKRMGWRFKWVSSHSNDFNFDYHVSFTKEDEAKGKVYYNYEMGEFMSDELPGLSVFYKDANGDIFHSYSTYARGLDILVGAYNFLDLVPKGRGENPESTMDWVRRRDQYSA